MITAAGFALLAFAVSLLTTLISLSQQAHQLAGQLTELRSLSPAPDEGPPIVVEATEVGYFRASKAGAEPLDFVVTQLMPQGTSQRIWTCAADWKAAAMTSLVRRAEGVVLSRTLRRQPKFIGPGLLTTFDPRPKIRRTLALYGLAVLLALLWAAAALGLIATGEPKLGASLALAWFLGMPLVERQLSIQAMAPDEPGRTFVAELSP